MNEQTLASLLGSIPVSSVLLFFFYKTVNGVGKFKDEVLKALASLDKSQALSQKDIEQAVKLTTLVAEQAQQLAKCQQDINYYFQELKELKRKFEEKK